MQTLYFAGTTLAHYNNAGFGIMIGDFGFWIALGVLGRV
jgi:hypothetical protein